MKLAPVPSEHGHGWNWFRDIRTYKAQAGRKSYNVPIVVGQKLSTTSYSGAVTLPLSWLRQRHKIHGQNVTYFTHPLVFVNSAAFYVPLPYTILRSIGPFTCISFRKVILIAIVHVSTLCPSALQWHLITFDFLWRQTHK